MAVGKQKVYCVDFDGTIHDIKHPLPEKKMGPPIVGALEAVRALYKRGTVIIFTQRGNDKAVRDWLTFYGFPRMEVTNIKPGADVYIDDKAVRFDSWALVLSTLKSINL